ncbi:hypothetical protein OF83DRAFT_755553 [Amylostereum chailletii]|nr:hypothetical protein OF83DRAFT_755553 [Amylostereum chailletii]
MERDTDVRGGQAHMAGVPLLAIVGLSPSERASNVDARDRADARCVCRRFKHWMRATGRGGGTGTSSAGGRGPGLRRGEPYLSEVASHCAGRDTYTYHVVDRPSEPRLIPPSLDLKEERVEEGSKEPGRRLGLCGAFDSWARTPTAGLSSPVFKSAHRPIRSSLEDRLANSKKKSVLARRPYRRGRGKRGPERGFRVAAGSSVFLAWVEGLMPVP